MGINLRAYFIFAVVVVTARVTAAIYLVVVLVNPLRLIVGADGLF
jgi:hypothetical protein